MSDLGFYLYQLALCVFHLSCLQRLTINTTWREQLVSGQLRLVRQPQPPDDIDVHAITDVFNDAIDEAFARALADNDATSPSSPPLPTTGEHPPQRSSNSTAASADSRSTAVSPSSQTRTRDRVSEDTQGVGTARTGQRSGDREAGDKGQDDSQKSGQDVTEDIEDIIDHVEGDRDADAGGGATNKQDDSEKAGHKTSAAEGEAGEGEQSTGGRQGAGGSDASGGRDSASSQSGSVTESSKAKEECASGVFSVKGCCCEFPVDFRGETFEKCIEIGHTTAWCYTDPSWSAECGEAPDSVAVRGHSRDLSLFTPSSPGQGHTRHDVEDGATRWWDHCEPPIVETHMGCQCQFPFEYKGSTHR